MTVRDKPGCKMAGAGAPFPWYGGKARFAPAINAALGSDLTVYAEPFFGSGAVLFSRRPAGREVVCDLDGMVANCWRALRNDPEMTAYYADWPTVHQDLTARRRFLVAWADEYADRLSEDEGFYCAKAAGYWVWCVSNWIGGPADMMRTHVRPDHPPQNAYRTGAQGVQAQRLTVPLADDRIPAVEAKASRVGRGVQADRKNVPLAMDVRPAHRDMGVGKIPHAGSARAGGGQGVQVQRKIGDTRPMAPNQGGGGYGVAIGRALTPLYDKRPLAGAGGFVGVSARHLGVEGITTGARLRPWFQALSERLARVIILNRSWQSALTPSLLQDTPSCKTPVVGVVLDPPYDMEQRISKGLYRHDGEPSVAAESWEWALAHGDRYRIAYCSYDGDIELPDGWTAHYGSVAGVQKKERRARLREMIAFSPACYAQGRLW